MRKGQNGTGGPAPVEFPAAREGHRPVLTYETGRDSTTSHSTGPQLLVSPHEWAYMNGLCHVTGKSLSDWGGVVPHFDLVA